MPRTYNRYLKQDQRAGASMATNGRPERIKVYHYNILASYLGNNLENWFLYFNDVNKLKDVEKFTKAYQQFSMSLNKIMMTTEPANCKVGSENCKYVNTNFRKWIDNCYPNFHNKKQCQAYIDAVELFQLQVKQIVNKEDFDVIEQIVKYNQEYFAWNKRGERIIANIKKEDPDIISLVELDQYDYFRQKLPEYDSYFFKRPRLNSADGCAIFFKMDKFKCIDFCPLQITYKDNDRVGLIVKLVTKQGKPIIVASTHLMREPDDQKLEETRLLEVTELLAKIDEIKEVSDLPVIICGDFNAYKVNRVIGKMRNASYSFIPTQGCTSKTLQRKDTIDYIFYNDQVRYISGTDDTSQICSLEGVWPNQREPSDHIPIMGIFEI